MAQTALACCIALGLAAQAIAEPEVLIDTDFGTADQPIVGRSGTPNELVTGAMAGDWRDDSGWSTNVQASWERMEEEGRAFVRLHVIRVEPDRYQLAHVLPKIEEETFYRVSFTARSISGLTIEIGMRDSGRPYQFHWSQMVALAASWRDYAYDFRLTELDQEIGFWINVGAVGEIELARLRLVRLTRADYIEELKRKYGERGPRNLVRISRFPLGLQSGWALGRDNSDGDDVQVGPDSDVVGPSGSPALAVRANEETTLYSAPFAVPLGFQPHTAGLYVRGTGELRLIVRCVGRQIAQQSFQLDGAADWQRVHVTFNPVLMAEAYGLQIIGTDTYWMDALQIAAGAEPVPYASELACEVSLACPPSDASVARIQFQNEPAQIEYCVTGDARGAVLRCKVVNAYGDERELPTIKLGALPATGRLRYGVLDARPLGPFRVEAWVEDADGDRISAYNELVVYRLPRPLYWGKDAPDSPFGVHTNSTTRHNLMAKAVGANWTRLHDAGLQYLGWWFLEREPGRWTFHDEELQRFRRDHIKILGELGTAPEWASYYPGKPHNGYFDRYYQPKRMADYANYVRTVCERYREVIDAYDVWNEPWIHAWWGVGYDETKSDRAGYYTSENPAADFARLMRTAHETAKSVDPSITILGFNSTTAPGGDTRTGGEDWTRGVLAAGGMDSCDVVCYHQYIGGKPGYPGDVCEEGFRTATGPIVERFGRNPKPVWMTEGSAGRDTIGPGFYHYTLPHPNRENPWETGDRLCRYVVSLLAQGVKRVFLYSMHAQSTLEARPNFRVIVTPEGYLHPSGAAHAILAWHLEDTEFVKVIEVADGVLAYLFGARDGSRSVAAISPAAGHADYVVPAPEGLAIRDLFGNPIAPGEALGDTLAYVTTDGDAEVLESALR